MSVQIRRTLERAKAEYVRCQPVSRSSLSSGHGRLGIEHELERLNMDLVTHAGSCPYCGEVIELVADTSAGDQHYIEDCSVCCRPIDIRVTTNVDGEADVILRHENDV